MKLYRAVQEKPVFSTTDLQRELAVLETERDNGPAGEYMVDAFQRMGKEKYLRLIELRQIVKDQQFFTNDQVQARYVAGLHHYMISMQVPDDVAAAHHVEEAEVLAVQEKPASGDNYSFTGVELADHLKEWNVEVGVFDEG